VGETFTYPCSTLPRNRSLEGYLRREGAGPPLLPSGSTESFTDTTWRQSDGSVVSRTMSLPALFAERESEDPPAARSGNQFPFSVRIR